jgi:hypothetical protein
LSYNSSGCYYRITLNDTVPSILLPFHQYIVFNIQTMDDCIVSNWNIITYDCGLYVQWIIAPSWIYFIAYLNEIYVS